MDRGWWATVHGVPKSWTQLSDFTFTFLLQQGGSERGLISTGKWIVQGDTCADQARDFIGKGSLGREQESKATQENCSAVWLTVSGFILMGLVSRLALAKHSDSESLTLRTWLSQDGCQ